MSAWCGQLQLYGGFKMFDFRSGEPYEALHQPYILTWEVLNNFRHGLNQQPTSIKTSILELCGKMYGKAL